MPVRLTVLSIVGWAFIIGGVVTAMWIPSIVISTRALVDAREDQMVASLALVREQVLNFFMVGSRAVRMMERMWKSAMEKDPDRPTQMMMAHYKEAMWHFLKENPTVSVLFASNLMRQEAVGYPQCDTSVAVFSGVVHINVYEGMSGVDEATYSEICKNQSSPYPCGEGTFRVHFTKSESDLADPAGPGRVYVDQKCFRGVASTANNWYPPASPLTNATYHGFTERMWDSKGKLQGQPTQRATVLRVAAPVAGPSWAPLSGLVGAQLRISDPAINVDTSKTLDDIIVEVVARTKLNMTIALFTSDLEMIGNSRGIENSRMDASGIKIGFVSGDNTSALPPLITNVASSLRQQHCKEPSDPWAPTCDWKGVDELLHIDSTTVAALPVEDPFAKGLGMLIVCIVKDSEIREAAERLTIQFAIISPIVLIVGCLVAFGFSYTISKPIMQFCSFLQDAAEMKDLELIARERNKSSYITEIVLMRRALSGLVVALVEYKSYLPTTLFKDDVVDGAAFQNIMSDTGSNNSSVPSKATEYSVPPPSRGSVGRTVCVLRRRKCVVLAINFASWTQHVLEIRAEDVSKEMHGYISLVCESTKKGTIDRFNGDQVLVSWNTSREVPSYRKVACQAAHSFRIGTVECDWLSTAVGIGIAGGTVLSGNAGINAIKAFNLIGVPVVQSIALANTASRYSEKVVILVSEQVVETGVQFVCPIAGSLDIRKLTRQNISFRKVFHELLDPMQGNDDWLYSAGEQSIDMIIKLFDEVFKDPSALPRIGPELYKPLSAVRSHMIYSDKGWAQLLSSLTEGDKASIFHEI